MSDDRLLLDVLTRFALALTGSYDLTAMLYELSESVVQVLGASSAGVSLADENRELQFMSATSEAARTVEATQQDFKEGPCYSAYLSGKPILITNLAQVSDWPMYRKAADSVGVVAVAGIPMVLDQSPVGALNIYQYEPREWSSEDVSQATVLANIATGYVSQVLELTRVRGVNRQLEDALESRVYIEQAKGIIAGERNITTTAAFEVLRSHARNKNAKLKAVAEAVVELGLRP